MVIPIIRKQFFLTPASGYAYLELTDQTDYTIYGILDSNVKGNFLINAPAGVIHNGTSWSTPDIDFTIPDISYTIQPPRDNNRVPQEGTYSHQYTIQITRTITDLNQGAKWFEIAGDLTGITPTSGSITIVDSTGNNGTYTIVSVALVGSDTRFTVAETIPSAVVDGDLQFYLTFDLVEYDFFWCAPEASISIAYDCVAPHIASTDNTSYNISRTGYYTSLAPTSLSRVHTLKYPSGITPVQPADSVTSGQTNTVNELYTETWQALIQTALVYILPNGGLLVNYTLTGAKSESVSCTAGLCTISQCVYNAMDAYSRALSGNYADLQSKQQMLLQIVGYWIKYSTALTCGSTQHQTEALNAIVAITRSNDCGCFPDSNISGTPQKVIGYGFAGGSSGTFVVATGSGGITVTSATVGTTTTYTVSLDFPAIAAELVANYDIIDNTTLAAWWVSTQNAFGANRVLTTNGSSVIVGTAQGSAFNKDFGVDPLDVPEIGTTLAPNLSVYTDANGKLITGAIPAANYRLLNNNNTVVTTGNTSATPLMSYSLAANTLAPNDSWIRVTGEVSSTGASPADINSLDFTFGTYTFSLIPYLGVGLRLYFQVEINRLTSNTQRIRIIVFQNGIPSFTYTPAIVSETQDLTILRTITVTASRALAAAGVTISCHTLRVELMTI